MFTQYSVNTIGLRDATSIMLTHLKIPNTMFIKWKELSRCRIARIIQDLFKVHFLPIWKFVNFFIILPPKLRAKLGKSNIRWLLECCWETECFQFPVVDQNPFYVRHVDGNISLKNYVGSKNMLASLVEKMGKWGKCCP